MSQLEAFILARFPFSKTQRIGILATAAIIVSFQIARAQSGCVEMFCPTNITVPCEGPWGAHVSFAVIATNICPPPQPQPTVTYSQPPGSIFPLGTTLVCATSSIPGSVSSVCCFEVTVEGCCGTNCIQIVCPPDSVFPCSSTAGGGAYVDLTQPQFTPYLTNVCGGGVPTSLVVGCSPGPPPTGGLTYFPPGENTVICCVTNLQTGYIDCCCFKIFVLTNCVQTTPGQCEVLAVCPTNVIVCTTNGLGTTNVPFLTPLLTNTCPGQSVAITGESWTTPPGSFFPLGKTTVGVCVTWVSSGALGQSVGTNCCCYDVLVTCCTNPCDSTLKCPSDMVLNCPGPGGVPLNYYAFGTNPCYPQATLDCTPPSGTTIYGNTNVCCKLEYFTALGTVVVLTQCCFNVTVLCPSNCVPIITCPSNIYVTCPKLVATRSGGVGTFVTYPSITVTDSCGLAVSNWCNPPSGSFFKLGPCTPVTCTAVDAAGNFASCTFQVCVLPPGCYVKNPSFELVVTNPLNACTEPVDDAVGWSTLSGAPTLFQSPAAVPSNCWDYSYPCNGTNYAGISGGWPLPAAYWTTDEMLGRLVVPLVNGRSYRLSACLSLTTNTSPTSPWNGAPPSIPVEFLLANSANPNNAANQYVINQTVVHIKSPAWQSVQTATSPCFVVPPTNVWDSLIIRIAKFPISVIGYVYVDNVNICCCQQVRIGIGQPPSLTYDTFGTPVTLQFTTDLTGAMGGPMTLGTGGSTDPAMGTLYLPMSLFTTFPMGFFQLLAPSPETVDCGCYP